MAITEGTLLELSLLMRWGGDTFMNVWGYECTGTFSGIDGASAAEAWWNDVKAVHRALVRNSSFFSYQSVLVREMNNPSGVLAEYNIPADEQHGSRTGVDTSEFLPSLNAAGIRLTVGSRVTRPGQKRIAGLLEDDVVDGTLSTAYTSLLNTFGSHMVSTLVLGVPAAGLELQPQVFGKDATGAVVRHQPIIGFVVDPRSTSQVSRRLGRGM